MQSVKRNIRWFGIDRLFVAVGEVCAANPLAPVNLGRREGLYSSRLGDGGARGHGHLPARIAPSYLELGRQAFLSIAGTVDERNSSSAEQADKNPCATKRTKNGASQASCSSTAASSEYWLSPQGTGSPE